MAEDIVDRLLHDYTHPETPVWPQATPPKTQSLLHMEAAAVIKELRARIALLEKALET